MMHGRFTPEQGERIMKAVDAAMDEIAEERKDVSAETSAEPDPDKPMPCPVEQRRADALERLAEGFLSGGEGSLHGGDRCTLHVHTDVDTLRADGQGAESTLGNGGRVSAETSRRLACDCGIVPWRESGDGETLDVGRKTRSIPPAIRRALQRRDGGCRFPGCTAQRFTDAHHVEHWADGGETRLDNLVTLCRHHHRAVHEGGFGVQMSTEGQPVFLDRHGRRIPEAPEMRFRGNVFALMTANRRAGADVSAETCIPDWDGERMDDDMVVDGLVALENPAASR